jgi:hypothetical protein
MTSNDYNDTLEVVAIILPTPRAHTAHQAGATVAGTFAATGMTTFYLCSSALRESRSLPRIDYRGAMENYRIVLQRGADSLLGSFNLSSAGHANCVRFQRPDSRVRVGGGGYTLRNV